MSNIEFRNHRRNNSNYGTLAAQDRDQLTLPFDVGDKREVNWFHGERKMRLSGVLGQLVGRIVREERVYYHKPTPGMTFMDADAIAALKDPDLRYALRFADAAATTGWENENSAACVLVVAENAGANSKLVAAVYSDNGYGNDVDGFLQVLHEEAPTRRAA